MNELIKKRRSVRHFKKEELSDDIVKDILEAGRWAPSPKNRQHWHFIVVRGDAKKEMLILMQKGVERTEKGEGLINVPKEWIADAYRTIQSCKTHRSPYFLSILKEKTCDFHGM